LSAPDAVAATEVMIASIVGDFHSGAIASFVDELGDRGVGADRVLKMSAFTWDDLSGLLRKLAAALAAQPLWRVARNWWRVEDDVGFWILNGGWRIRWGEGYV